MFPYRMFLGRSLCACVAAMLFAIGQTVAAERQYATPLGVVVVDVDSNWSEMSSLPDALEGIGFEVENGRVMQFMLGIMEGLPQGSADAGTLRQLTNDLRRAFIAKNIEVSEDLMSFSGPNFRGCYYHATNPASMPEPGDFKQMYLGFIAVGTDPLMFIIGWNAGGKTAADRALTTLKRLRIERR